MKKIILLFIVIMLLVIFNYSLSIYALINATHWIDFVVGLVINNLTLLYTTFITVIFIKLLKGGKI